VIHHQRGRVGLGNNVIEYGPGHVIVEKGGHCAQGGGGRGSQGLDRGAVLPGEPAVAGEQHVLAQVAVDRADRPAAGLADHGGADQVERQAGLEVRVVGGCGGGSRGWAGSGGGRLPAGGGVGERRIDHLHRGGGGKQRWPRRRRLDVDFQRAAGGEQERERQQGEEDDCADFHC